MQRRHTFGLPIGPCLLALVFMMALGAGHRSLQASAAQDDALDAYLQRLQLSDLRIAHLQRLMRSESRHTEKIRIGRRLADLYADKLMRVAADPSEYQTTLSEVQSLLASVPAANTHALQVMLHQAEYLRAEEFILQWIENRRDEDSRNTALTILAGVVHGLDQQLIDLNEKIARLSNEISETEDGDQQVQLEDELHRTQIVHLRASYYGGWANYYAGVLEGSNDRRTQQLDRSEALFRDFVAIGEDDDISTLEDGWVDLTSGLQVRGFAGLGMTLAAKGDVESSDRVFEILNESDETTNALREAPVWTLLSWLNAANVEKAMEVATSTIESFGGRATQEQSRFCVALIRFAEQPPEGISVPPEMAAMGVEGLVRLRQFTLIHELTNEYSLAIDAGENFYLTWGMGNLEFAKGEATHDRSHYLAAVSWLERALALPTAQEDASSSGHCHYQLGWSLFLTDQFEKAAEIFERASLLLKPFDEETAVNAAWKRYECFRKLAEEDDSFQTMAVESLRAVKIGFPDSRLARTASFHLSRLEQATSTPEENIELLEAIEPSDSQYVSARYELCMLYHGKWHQALTAGDSVVNERNELVGAVETFLSVANDESGARRMKAMMLLVDVGLRSDPPDDTLTDRYLAAARSIYSEVSPGSSVLAEYHYRRFQVARQENRSADAESEAEWLVEHALNTDYGMSALVLLAQQSDRALQSATGDARRPLLEKSQSIYLRMVEALGTNTASLESNRNARVALYRLGNVELELGQVEDAAQRFEQLLAYDDRVEAYLKGAGTAWFNAGRFDVALPHWTKLSLGVTRGSEQWFEAQFYAISCLEKTDIEEARKVLTQFRLLYPSGTADNWDDSFAQLERRIGLN